MKRVTVILAGRDTFVCLKADGIIEDDEFIRAFTSTGDMIGIFPKSLIAGAWVTEERLDNGTH